MATKTVSISPPAAQAAGCTATCISYVDDATTSDATTTTIFTNYRLEAAQAAGWQFVRFEETWKLSEYDGQSVTQQTTNLANNPWPGMPDMSSPTMPTEYVRRVNNPGRYTIRAQEEIISLVAIFEPAPHVPTHLLVNSASRPSPVRLTYDPDSNLLVADY